MTENEKQLHDAAYQAVVKEGARVEADPYRQVYHRMPPVGLLNDPNGWIQWNGTYHLFFQWNPFAPDHTHKFWGHWTSEDLINWNEEPIALAPSEWFEKNGCYSGSAMELDGKLALLYTGNVKDENNQREAYQCLALSEDGKTFEKKGPLVNSQPEGYTAHFRDPKVWEENGAYYFVIGAQTESEEGQVLLYRSTDFQEWDYIGPFAGSHLNGLGAFGYMWECPDLFKLDGEDVLIVSPQGLEQQGNRFENVYQAGYFTGRADLEAPSFTHGEFRELDEGFEFYAPQTTLDEKGRRLLFGWMGVPDSDEEHQPTTSAGWIHCMTVPRVLRVENGAVVQEPAEELEALRAGEPLEMKVQLAQGAEAAVTPASEIVLETNSASEFSITIRDGLTLTYENGLLTMSRPSFKDGSIETRSTNIASIDELRLFLDSSSAEVFVDGGRTVMTARFFPEPEANIVRISGEGSVIWRSWELA
ncbi:sucrose-6-phosphate hydrolase [Alkalicoccus luteus]|uniref:Sucrose-6-phosphate hydrolase n=1 Tax=Alkalicoccus luteus TaxID=1237094 RepID=A0A969PPX9_9BACI|nr:sucrose-6-phosphate hydrolase [Alkalicoccus luteus]NJP38231.1 sucrose-6-phosphate hydrolase [Alkalicoccus luteus]